MFLVSLRVDKLLLAAKFGHPRSERPNSAATGSARKPTRALSKRSKKRLVYKIDCEIGVGGVTFQPLTELSPIHWCLSPGRILAESSLGKFNRSSGRPKASRMQFWCEAEKSRPPTFHKQFCKEVLVFDRIFTVSGSVWINCC